MGAPRSRGRESALPASPAAPRLRRSHSFSRSPGASRYVRLYRSRNLLPRHEVPSRRLHPEIPEPRTYPAVARFLRHPFSSRFRRNAAGPRQAQLVALLPWGSDTISRNLALTELEHDAEPDKESYPDVHRCSIWSWSFCEAQPRTRTPNPDRLYILEHGGREPQNRVSAWVRRRRDIL